MAMPRLANFGEALMNGFGRLADGPSMPGLNPAENDAAKQRHQMAMLSQILQGTQASRNPQSGLAVLGQGIAAGQQAKDQFGADQIRAKLYQAQIGQMQRPSSADRLVGVANPSDFTPDSLAKYQTTGNPGDLEPVEQNLFGRYNPRDYTPESLAKFQQTGNAGDLQRIAPFQAQVTPGGGINRFDPISGTVSPTDYTAAEGTAEAGDKARVTAEASAQGQALGTAQGAILTRAMNSENIDSILDIAEPLIDEATGSGTGAARDKLAAFFGESTQGAQAIAQLLPLQAAIMLNQPRMEGPQSDRDVQLYREAAGQLGDPSIPGATKKAALQTIRRLQEQYRVRANPPEQATEQPSALPDFGSLSDEELQRLINDGL